VSDGEKLSGIVVANGGFQALWLGALVILRLSGVDFQTLSLERLVARLPFSDYCRLMTLVEKKKRPGSEAIDRPLVGFRVWENPSAFRLLRYGLTSKQK
jgi:hypothetical protein